jgi:hypothetical protein
MINLLSLPNVIIFPVVIILPASSDTASSLRPKRAPGEPPPPPPTRSDAVGIEIGLANTVEVVAWVQEPAARDWPSPLMARLSRRRVQIRPEVLLFNEADFLHWLEKRRPQATEQPVSVPPARSDEGPAPGPLTPNGADGRGADPSIGVGPLSDVLTIGNDRV